MTVAPSRVQLAQRAAHALLGVERALGGRLGQRAAGRLGAHQRALALIGRGELAQVELLAAAVSAWSASI